MDNHQDSSPFVVVDYGAADGLNSVPMIMKCAARLKELPENKEKKIKLQFLHGDFHSQITPDETVDLGISVSAVHWLSRRPGLGSNLDPQYPDDMTKQIAAKDWSGFLQRRAKELKKGGRLTVAVYVTGKGSPVARSDAQLMTVAPQPVIIDMFKEEIITEEEFEYARVFPIILRTEEDLRAPFLDPVANMLENLELLDITTHIAPDPFYDKWVRAGGLRSPSATEEYIRGHVDSVKSFYNSFWTILEVTRSREVHLDILDNFYRRVEEMVRGHPEGFHASVSVAVVNVVKVW